MCGYCPPMVLKGRCSTHSNDHESSAYRTSTLAASFLNHGTWWLQLSTAMPGDCRKSPAAIFQMGVSIDRGPQDKPKFTMILIIRSPKRGP